MHTNDITKSVLISAKLEAAVRKAAFESGASQSGVMRKAIETYLEGDADA